MNETELCQSLMSAIAETPCPDTCGTAAIHAADLVLLWDDRAEVAWMALDDVASEFGEVLTTASISRGPHGRAMTGAIVRPHDRNLDAVATSLRTRYNNATKTTKAKPAFAPVATPIATQRRAEFGHPIPDPVRKPRRRRKRGTSSP